MERKAYNVSLKKNPVISMKVIPGHFTTSNAHLNHYLDVSELKSNAMIARDVAQELAIPYLSSSLVDTIVCMERTEVIGAYLAEELRQSGHSAVNQERDIHVVTPLNNSIGHLFFQSSMVENITNRNIVLLTATVSSGHSLASTLDCISYYKGNIVGISALFLASSEKSEFEINALFKAGDIPGYKMYDSRKCDLCIAGEKLDALISSEGYTKI